MNTIFYQVTIFHDVIKLYRIAIDSKSLWLHRLFLENHKHGILRHSTSFCIKILNIQVGLCYM